MVEKYAELAPFVTALDGTSWILFVITTLAFIGWVIYLVLKH